MPARDNAQQPMEPGDELFVYPGKDGRLRLQARMRADTLWLTQKQMADLFGLQLPAISKHLKNIFESGELAENAVLSILEITADDGKNYATRFYNLDAVIAVGYRVNSVLATHFRIWATQVLRDVGASERPMYLRVREVSAERPVRVSCTQASSKPSMCPQGSASPLTPDTPTATRHRHPARLSRSPKCWRSSVTPTWGRRVQETA